MLGPGPLDARFGLKSWLFLRERGACAVDEIPGFDGGRNGEVSREGLVEFVVDVGTDV